MADPQGGNNQPLGNDEINEAIRGALTTPVIMTCIRNAIKKKIPIDLEGGEQNVSA